MIHPIPFLTSITCNEVNDPFLKYKTVTMTLSPSNTRLPSMAVKRDNPNFHSVFDHDTFEGVTWREEDLDTSPKAGQGADTSLSHRDP